MDKKGSTAIIFVNNKIKVDKSGEEEGYIWAVTEHGVLMSPNESDDEFGRYLDGIRDTIVIVQHKKCIVAGDMNAKAFAWDSAREDARGKILTEWMAQMELDVANETGVATCVRGNQRSVLDLTMKSQGTNITKWRVNEEENLSDHRTIEFSISDTIVSRREQGIGNAGWRLSEQGMENFNRKMIERKRRGNNSFTAGEMQDYAVQCLTQYSRKRQQETETEDQPTGGIRKPRRKGGSATGPEDR